jgi:hypothetical protein
MEKNAPSNESTQSELHRRLFEQACVASAGVLVGRAGPRQRRSSGAVSVRPSFPARALIEDHPVTSLVPSPCLCPFPTLAAWRGMAGGRLSRPVPNGSLQGDPLSQRQKQAHPTTTATQQTRTTHRHREQRRGITRCTVDGTVMGGGERGARASGTPNGRASGSSLPRRAVRRKQTCCHTNNCDHTVL